MAVNLDDFTNFLGDIFSNEESQEAFQQDPDGFLNVNGFGNVTAFEVEQAANRIFAPQQGASVAQDVGPVLHPLPDTEAFDAPSGGGLSAATEAIRHYTNVYNTTYDNDQAFDTSTNNNITAFGSDIDLDQDIDNNIATGEDAVAGVEGSQVQTGDGIQAGDDIEDSNLVQGDVEDAVLADDISDSQVLAGSTVGGSVVGGDVNDSILGDDNQAIIDSEVGAASFGSGDATNVEAEQAALGDDNVLIGDDLDGNANFGNGDQTVVQNSSLNESAVGDSTVQSNDISVGQVDDGSAVAFGGGDASGSNVDITNDDGTVQVAGDDAALDQSYTVEDSFNTTVEDSYNDQSTDIDDSFNDASSEVIQSDDVNVGQGGDDVHIAD